VEKVTLYWKPKAISHIKKQAIWYAENMGTSAAEKFWNGIITSADLLTDNPYLGKIEPSLSNTKKTYRSLVHHKDFKIIYTIENDNEIQIVAIWHCRIAKY
jgi:plasmid stabilization system protein ParE